MSRPSSPPPEDPSRLGLVERATDVIATSLRRDHPHDGSDLDYAIDQDASFAAKALFEAGLLSPDKPEGQTERDAAVERLCRALRETADGWEPGHPLRVRLHGLAEEASRL